MRDLIIFSKDILNYDIEYFYTPTKTELEKLILSDRRFVASGYALFGESRLLGLETLQKWEKDREDLLDFSPDFQSQIGSCRAWLKGIKKIGSANNEYTSYGLKHLVEDWLRKKDYEGHTVRYHYISNSAFILAAKIDGFKLYDFGNPVFNISAKSIKARLSGENEWYSSGPQSKHFSKHQEKPNAQSSS